MNEPLNNAHPGISFSGKTHNNHPQWYNQPLRLTKEQKQDPLPVLDDFFECYHLTEVRQLLWEWLTEVISSQRSIAIEPHDRNNHIYFYEKIEGIIEAAFILKKRLHKHRHRNRKRKLKEIARLEKKQASAISERSNTTESIPTTQTQETGEILNKPKQLIEYVDTDPIYVIREVFNNESLSFLRDQLRDWLYVAMAADCHIYEDGEQRRQLLSFQDQLLVLVEALFIIYIQNRDKEIEKQITESDKTRLLSQDQIATPMRVIADFFKKFPMVYIIRELNDWLEVSICFAGEHPENMSELQALFTYRNVLCLIKAAKQLLTH
ncbi:MAG: hypothetical protein ABI675_00060 [Chitinophagaceae bacterium]